jgi:hypothetical protein
VASVGLFCKSFRRDLSRFVRLFESVLAHDRDRMPFVLSVPREDEALFRGRLGNGGGRLHIVTDEQILGRASRPGWRGQQVVKLEAWRLRFADVFLVLDSDFFFVRDFGAADLVVDGRPRFVVSRQWHLFEPGDETLVRWVCGEPTVSPLTPGELASWRGDEGAFGSFQKWRVWLDKWQGRGLKARLSHVRRVVRRPGPELQFMPGPIWSVGLMQRFEAEFLRPRRLTAADLIRLSPWECHWVGEWLVATGFEGAVPSEPLFLHFDSDAGIEAARAAGLRKDDFARRYLGLAFAAGHQALEEYGG